ncbi:MAG: hypothetical protein Q9163_003805 [Psora crenata]
MSPLNHAAAHQVTENELEKGGDLKESSINIATTGGDVHRDSATSYADELDRPPTPVLLKDRLAKWNAKVEGLAGVEGRGITRVLPEEKRGGGVMGYLQMFTLWFSINVVGNNLILGFFGPLVFNLAWVDCVCIVLFANGLSACGAAYISTFGPQSGHRTMILGRYFMGYWPSKITCILNIILNVGWGIIASIFAGQVFSAVNGAGLTIAVGCVISALCIGLVATFGIAILHIYERYAWIPQVFALLVLVGSAGRNFNTSFPSTGSPGTITANRCSFFAFEFSTIIGFSAVGADFYVYYPTNTSKRLTFLMTWSGMWTALIFVNLIGVAIATGVSANPAWSDAYSTSSGALVLACYEGLGGFGGFCTVILALGGVANNAPATYAAALSIQVLGRYAKAVPRWVWCLILMIIELVCAVAGRNDLFHIFENFLPLMSYWASPWLMIVVEEHLIFRALRGVPFDWTAWEDKKRLPVGIAALISWLIGWAGAIIGMYQVWYEGPVAAKVGGGHGGDIGAWLAIAFTCITYPPLRYLELKKFGR